MACSTVVSLKWGATTSSSSSWIVVCGWDHVLPYNCNWMAILLLLLLLLLLRFRLRTVASS
jgi:hypothetical protein